MDQVSHGFMSCLFLSSVYVYIRILYIYSICFSTFDTPLSVLVPNPVWVLKYRDVKGDLEPYLVQ